MPLKRLPQDKLEEESFIFLQDFFNAHNWEFVRQVRDKSGIDAEIEIVSGIERSGKFLKAQIKAGRSYVSSESEEEIKVRVQRKYLEHWNRGNSPVILFFYDPTAKRTWWKAIKEYLRAELSTLRGLGKDCIIRFRKEQDLLAPESLSSFKLVADRKFDYTKIACELNQAELLWSTWFEVESFPKGIWIAPTNHASRRTIVPDLNKLYAFTIRNGSLFTLSDLSSENCELAQVCDRSRAAMVPFESVDTQVFKELLNMAIDIFARLKGLEGPRNRLYFPPEVLKNPAQNTYAYTSLKGRQETRTKIYIQGKGGLTEYKHHAVGLSFIQHSGQWYLEIDPEWYFSYPYLRRISRREAGARITSEKADTLNKDFLYLLHFWRQFLSDGSGWILVPCSSLDDDWQIRIASKPMEFVAKFRLFNDYSGPREIHAEDR